MSYLRLKTMNLDGLLMKCLILKLRIPGIQRMTKNKIFEMIAMKKITQTNTNFHLKEATETIITE